MSDLPQNKVQYQEITSDSDGQRLDNYLLKTLRGVPKSHIYRIIRSGEVRINMKRVKPSNNLHTGDLVRIPPIRTSQEKTTVIGENFANHLLSSIIYEDDKLLVINKPSGMAVHGGSGVSVGVIEALRKLRSDIPYLELVHRLDRETSGCLVLAKKRSQLRAIQALLEKRDVKKTYWALLSHPWQGKKMEVVDAALEKNILSSGERIVKVDSTGKPSTTTFRLLENYEQACMVEASPKTGRTHQIRVHSAYLGHPILGDKKYGDDLEIKNLSSIKVRLCLHARAITFKLNGQVYLFEAKPDELFETTRSLLRNENAI
ncbi:MAG: RluA family pseudouridine synthase [Legionellaceae bacterium]|nr:RluA family pseudouridine synthase [Legionellaceae bacterium]